MAKDIPIFERQVGNITTPFIQPSNRQVQALQGAASIFAGVAEQSFKTAEESIHRSNTIARMTAENTASIELNKIYNRNQSDPDQLNKEATGFLKGLEKDVPQAELQNLRNSYTAKLDSFLKRSFNNRNTAINQQHELVIRQNRDIHVNNLSLASKALTGFEEGMTEEERIIQTTSAFDLAAQSLNRIKENTQLKKTDGSFFFTPEQQMKMVKDSTQFWMSETAKQWIGAQPDKIDAYTKWQNGEVVFQVEQDGELIEINLREQISPDALAKVDKDMVQSIKDNISLRSRLESLEEKRLKQVSDGLDKEFAIKAQEGTLTLEEVDAVKNDLEPNAFIRNRKLAIQADPINRSDVEARLLTKIAIEKLDVAAEIENARFVDKTIDTATMNSLLALNEKQQEGTFDAVDSGRVFLSQSLGGASKLLDEIGSTVGANAGKDYKVAIENFIKENGREPQLQEAFNIAEEVSISYNLLAADELLQTFPKPKFMPIGKKAKAKTLTLEDIQTYKTQTYEFFSNKYSGNKEQALQDPELIEEIRRLEKFENVLSQTNR